MCKRPIVTNMPATYVWGVMTVTSKDNIGVDEVLLGTRVMFETLDVLARGSDSSMRLLVGHSVTLTGFTPGGCALSRCHRARYLYLPTLVCLGTVPR